MIDRPWRTSDTDPLRVDAAAVPGTATRIGMTFCPGKHQSWGQHAAWRRDLLTDLEAIRVWGATTLITLIEDHEFAAVGVEALPDTARQVGLNWLHWPIVDCDAPDERFEQAWQQEFPGVKQQLQSGHSIVLHCMGGMGRTGTVAALMLTEFGMAPDEAVDSVRAARPGTIETAVQLRYVMGRGQ